MAKLMEIEKKQNTIIENQKRMNERINSEFLLQKVTYDKVYRMLKEMHLKGTPFNKDEKETILEQQLGEKFKFPLSTVEDVFLFNKEIGSNEKYRKYLLDCFSSIGGTEGNEEGKIIAKKLRTILLTEHVLTLFSWTGVSRTPGMAKKESFQLCENIIKLFLELINKADNHWNITKNEKFFKFSTLKHAKQNEKACKKRKKAEEDKTNGVINVEYGSQVTQEPETDDGMQSNVGSEGKFVGLFDYGTAS